MAFSSDFFPQPTVMKKPPQVCSSLPLRGSSFCCGCPDDVWRDFSSLAVSTIFSARRAYPFSERWTLSRSVSFFSAAALSGTLCCVGARVPRMSRTLKDFVFAAVMFLVMQFCYRMSSVSAKVLCEGSRVFGACVVFLQQPPVG